MTSPVPPQRAPVEAKVQAAGVAGVVSGALIWILQTYVFKATLDPGLVSLIYAAVPGALAFGAAYLAPHTPRGVGLIVPGQSGKAALSPTGTVTVVSGSGGYTATAGPPEPPAPPAGASA